MPYKKEDFIQWIEASESNYGQVKREYEDARNYFEDEQEPTGVPSGKEYVTVNLGNDLVRRRVGEVVSGGIRPALIGGGRAAKPLKYLFLDILEENKFIQNKVANSANFFYNEGLSGYKFAFNPFKKSKYGIGMPVIDFLRYDEIWLDPDARDPLHEDDKFRIVPKRIELEYAKDKWPDSADEIQESLLLTDTGDQTEIKRVDLYEIEYRETVFTEENGKRIEEDVFYICKIVNKNVVVEGPEPTGYPVFRIIPLIHTPRILNKGKYPFGIQKITRKTQDQINVIESVILDWVKAAIKQLIILRGATTDEEAKVKSEAAKTTGVVTLRNPNARLDVVTAEPIPPHLSQLAAIKRMSFDEISGSYAPERGAVAGELSGKAIRSLQTAGIIPEFASIANFNNALTDLGVCIFTCIVQDMNQPFSIFPEINGTEQEIRFNAVQDETIPDNEMHIFHGGTVPGANVNVLRLMKVNRIKMTVELNVEQNKEMETNKALLMRERGDLALIDVMQALWPDNWQEKLENVKSEQAIMQLVQDMVETAPEYINIVAQQWQQIKPELVAAQQQLEKQGQQINRNGR